MARPTTVDDRQDRRVKMRVVLVKRDRWLWLGDGVSRWWAVRVVLGGRDSMREMNDGDGFGQRVVLGGRDSMREMNDGDGFGQG
ncbi:hypothetical protein V6N12_050831 [Hibiscus sabdariffa]|uniref:Uncharacterized protein n=1 Tax=Hibiscus sabdariffa TaxID=183260 RepID=A0ABR2GEE1_9ROSI